MPRGNNISKDDLLIKLLLMGFSKSGKTHWTLEAARAGFNLVYLDGDVARQTLAQFPDEIKKRVYYFPIGDTLQTARMCQLVDKMLTTPHYLWNDTKAKSFTGTDSLEDSAVWELKLSLLTPRDILVIDSWTTLSTSAIRYYALQNGYDLNTFDELNSRQKQQLYQGAGGRLTHICLALKAAPCHVVVIAHPDEYEHRSRPSGAKAGEVKEKDHVIEYTKQIPKSCSKPHGATMAMHFSDVLEIAPTGFKDGRYVDGRPDPSKSTGGRFNQRKDSDEYSFVNLVRKIGGLIPDPSDHSGTPGIVDHAIGEYAPPSLGKVDGSKTTNLAGSGLTGGLVKKTSTFKL